jgi:hypothetical protein
MGLFLQLVVCKEAAGGEAFLDGRPTGDLGFVREDITSLRLHYYQ